MANIRQRYKEARTNHEKNAYANLCASKLLTMQLMEDVLGISSKRLRASTSPSTSRGHTHAIRRILRRKRLVREFFMSDEVSRMLPRKKTVTQNKLKKQKRVLCDTLQNLHTRFRDTQPMCTVRYPSFCRMRPFWVVSPTQTPVCALHTRTWLFCSLSSMNLMINGCS